MTLVRMVEHVLPLVNRPSVADVLQPILECFARHLLIHVLLNPVKMVPAPP